MAAVAAVAMLASESAEMVSVRVFMLRVGCWMSSIADKDGVEGSGDFFMLASNCSH